MKMKIVFSLIVLLFLAGCEDMGGFDDWGRGWGHGEGHGWGHGDD